MLSLTGCQQELGAMGYCGVLRRAVVCPVCSKRLQEDAGFFLGVSHAMQELGPPAALTGESHCGALDAVDPGGVLTAGRRCPMGLEAVSITATRPPSTPSRLSTPLLELLFLSQQRPQHWSIVLGLRRVMNGAGQPQSVGQHWWHQIQVWQSITREQWCGRCQPKPRQR